MVSALSLKYEVKLKTLQKLFLDPNVTPNELRSKRAEIWRNSKKIISNFPTQ